jgi:hypothetical protein
MSRPSQSTRRAQGAAGSSESTAGVGFNVNQFYRYPMNRVAAIFDDLARTTGALPQLEQAGFDLTAVTVLSGREGARLLNLEGTGQGPGRVRCGSCSAVGHSREKR